jgi:hypothetical protein
MREQIDPSKSGGRSMEGSSETKLEEQVSQTRPNATMWEYAVLATRASDDKIP